MIEGGGDGLRFKEMVRTKNIYVRKMRGVRLRC